jgi:hypothetical protein
VAIIGNATLPSSCINTSSIDNEENNVEKVLIYPNPFNSSATIKLENASLNYPYELLIYNSLGVVVMSKSITSNFTEIYSNEMPNGVYFYNIIDNENRTISGTLITTE